MGKSCANMRGSLIGLIMALAKQSMPNTPEMAPLSGCYPAQAQCPPWALRNGAPFTQLPQAFAKLQGLILKRPGGDREMVEILALVLHHDEQAVLCAVELALDAGVATKTHVLNILHRLTDANAPPAPPIDAPQALRLTQEPVANVERYDGLRNKELSAC